MKAGRRAPLVDVAAIKRQVVEREAEEREQIAQRFLTSVEASVLGAMITRYDFELFADVEVDDFFALPHKHVFGALRVLEVEGKSVDGEFLLADIAAELERQDAALERHVRDRVTDDFLAALVRDTKRGEPGSHVVPARGRASIAKAIATLKAAAICRSAYSSAVEVVDCMTAVRARE